MWVGHLPPLEKEMEKKDGLKQKEKHKQHEETERCEGDSGERLSQHTNRGEKGVGRPQQWETRCKEIQSALQGGSKMGQFSREQWEVTLAMTMLGLLVLVTVSFNTQSSHFLPTLHTLIQCSPGWCNLYDTQNQVYNDARRGPGAQTVATPLAPPVIRPEATPPLGLSCPGRPASGSFLSAPTCCFLLSAPYPCVSGGPGLWGKRPSGDGASG